MKWLLGVLLILWSAHAFAQGVEDFDPLGEDWYGLRDFVSTASAMGMEVEVLTTLNYRDLDTSARLVIVYPLTTLDGESLGAFVADGGRLALWDDFGESEDFLTRLEITRVVPSPGNLPHNQYVDGSPAFPIFEPEGRHPLLDGVRRVVANHASVLSNPGGPVIGFSAGGALVYDMNMGEGKALIISDASLVINQMLNVADNAAFVRNTLEYLCENQRPCTIQLVVGEFESEGRYSTAIFGDGGVSDGIESFNDLLQKLMEQVLIEELLFYLSILLAIGLGAYLGSVFPLRPTRPYSAYVTDFFAQIPGPQSEFDWNLSRFASSNRTSNFALPMSILKETFEELFLRELGLWPTTSQNRPDIEALSDLFEKRFLQGHDPKTASRMRQETLDLLGSMASIPPRNRVFLDSDAHFSHGDLLRTHRKVMQTLKVMGLQDEYKRRANGDV